MSLPLVLRCKIYSLLIISIFFLFTPKIILAESLTFTIPTTSLDSGQELLITASASGFSENENLYLKAAFYKEGSTNYFGKTKTDGGWVKNSATIVVQKKVTIGLWDQILIAQSDPEDTGFVDSGNYKLKIGYYQLEANGEPKSVKWSQTIADVFLKRPDPTVAPTQTPTKTPTPNPTNTTTPQATNTPTKIPTKKPTPTKDVEPTQEDELTDQALAGEVLGDETINLTPTPEIITTQKSAKKIPQYLIISLCMVGVGTGMLAIYTLVPRLIKQYKKQKNED